MMGTFLFAKLEIFIYADPNVFILVTLQSPTGTGWRQIKSKDVSSQTSKKHRETV